MNVAVHQIIPALISNLKNEVDNRIHTKFYEMGIEDLQPAHGAVLSVVNFNGGKAQMNAIVKSTYMKRTTVIEMVNRLVKLGYLTKEKGTEDRRETYVITTEKARAIQNNLNKAVQEAVDAFLEDYSNNEKDELLRLLLKAVRSYGS